MIGYLSTLPSALTLTQCFHCDDVTHPPAHKHSAVYITAFFRVFIRVYTH